MTGNKHTRRKAEIVLPLGGELYWQIIRKLNTEGTWTVPDITAFADAPRGAAQAFVMRMERGGFVRRVGKTEPVNGTRSVLYEVAIDRPVMPRVGNKGVELPEKQTEVLWRTMRMLKRFTIKDLAGHIAELDRPVNVAVIRTFVTRLLQAGILVHDGKVAANQWQPYRLARMLGPQAPRLLLAHVVFDPNSGATIGAAETREVAI